MWRQREIEPALFNTSREVDDLITAVENIFTEKLEQGDRQKAMKRLRVPPLSERHTPQAIFLFGFFSGVFIIQIAVIILACLFLRPLPLYYIPALRIFRGTLLLIIFFCLFGVNTYGWRSSGVNNVLIFELDPRTHLEHFELLQISFFMAVIWGFSVICFIFSEVMGFPAYISPFVLVIFLLLYLINPFNFGHLGARKWLFRIMFRIVRAPFAKVSFADFWLADQLNSLNFIFFDFALFICFYCFQLDWSNMLAYVPLEATNMTFTGPVCARTTNRIIAEGCQCEGLLFGLEPILKTLPAWFRFAQCLRRYRDMEIKKANPHLLNAGKYSTSFFLAITTAWFSYDQTLKSLILYVISAIIQSAYTYSWDILMDWGLMDCSADSKLLRDELVYRYKAYYYMAIIGDLILRLTWIPRVILDYDNHQNFELFVTVFSVLEVFRRFVWNFFRLENEHLNNCGQFRAVRDIFITAMPKRPVRINSLNTFTDNQPHPNAKPSSPVYIGGDTPMGHSNQSVPNFFGPKYNEVHQVDSLPRNYQIPFDKQSYNSNSGRLLRIMGYIGRKVVHTQSALVSSTEDGDSTIMSPIKPMFSLNEDDSGGNLEHLKDCEASTTKHAVDVNKLPTAGHRGNEDAVVVQMPTVKDKVSLDSLVKDRRLRFRVGMGSRLQLKDDDESRLKSNRSLNNESNNSPDENLINLRNSFFKDL